MRLVAGLVAVVALLAGCASPPPPDTLKNLYEVEHAARQMKPQSDVALLYLTSTEKNQGNETALRINGELSMQKSFFDGQFYVFCLPPGKYDIVYRGDFLIPNKQEFLQAEAGGIYVRDFSQFAAVILYIPLTASKLRDMEVEQAKSLIASKRIGTEVEYANSKYRCRSLQ